MKKITAYQSERGTVYTKAIDAQVEDKIDSIQDRMDSNTDDNITLYGEGASGKVDGFSLVNWIRNNLTETKEIVNLIEQQGEAYRD